MDLTVLEQQLAQLPLYTYAYIDPKKLEFSERVRYICAQDCAMYGKSWACPPAVGTVEQCRAHCLRYEHCLLISSVTEVADISDLAETLATRAPHEALTDRVRALLCAQGVTPFVLSTEACAICERCAYMDGAPCRFPNKMHPCVESQGINIVPVLEENGLEFQFGDNIVTWVSLLFY